MKYGKEVVLTATVDSYGNYLTNTKIWEFEEFISEKKGNNVGLVTGDYGSKSLITDLYFLSGGKYSQKKTTIESIPFLDTNQYWIIGGISLFTEWLPYASKLWLCSTIFSEPTNTKLPVDLLSVKPVDWVSRKNYSFTLFELY